MAAKSAIEWTESTWNPVTGCTKISAGCANCYAERMAGRLQAMGQPRYAKGFAVAAHAIALPLPLQWKKSQMIFVNSMGDLFHDRVTDSFILKVFDVMHRADWHVFQLLTKRSARLAALAPRLPWKPHIWMGVTVESADYIQRIDHLRQTGAHTKFLSIEPMLGPMPNLNLRGLDWVIVGGESGPGARPMQKAWAVDVREQCQQAGVAFFFKQWGGFRKKQAGRKLEGRTWDDMPPLPPQAQAVFA